MKKLMFLFVVCFVLSISLKAQNEKFFRLGLIGIPNASWFKSATDEHKYDGIKMGLGYGLVAEFSLADHYSFATGIESIYTGGKLKWNSGDVDSISDVEALYKFQFIDLPLMLKMKTKEIGYITYFAKFGGSISTRIRSAADYTYKLVADNSTQELEAKNINKDINLLRVAFSVGAGIEYSLGGSTSVLAGVNFNNGLTPIFNKKGEHLLDWNQTKKKAINNYVSLHVGILF